MAMVTASAKVASVTTRPMALAARLRSDSSMLRGTSIETSAPAAGRRIRKVRKGKAESWVMTVSSSRPRPGDHVGEQPDGADADAQRVLTHDAGLHPPQAAAGR